MDSFCHGDLPRGPPKLVWFFYLCDPGVGVELRAEEATHLLETAQSTVACAESAFRSTAVACPASSGRGNQIL